MSYGDYQPNKGLFGTAVKWILFVAALALIVSVIGYFFGWFNTALKVTSPEKIQMLSREANNSWQALKAGQQTIANIESDVHDMSVLYGEDASKWPQGKHDEYLQLKTQLRNLKTAYNSSCGQYNAMWQDEWRSIPAPDDLPTHCELIN